MNVNNRLTRWILFGIIGVAILVVAWGFNSFVTPFDRPFFLSDKKETIIVTRVAWMCNCADFIDTTKYNGDPVTEPANNDYFFIEAANPEQNWDRDHFIINKYARLTGRFYIDKGIPREYEYGHMEDKPEHARIFKFDKIEYITDDN